MLFLLDYTCQCFQAEYYFPLGDLWQLPPIYDNIITDNNRLDGRPDFAPSHWKDNFKIYYLTQKMRSKEDAEFSSVCDRVGRAKITNEDEKFLRSRILKTNIEDNNENFKTGKISIVVTTNLKKDLVNSQKLNELLPNELKSPMKTRSF